MHHRRFVGRRGEIPGRTGALSRICSARNGSGPGGCELVRQNPQAMAGIRFVFPMAPIELDPGGFYDSRAWWPIDMLRLQQMMEAGELRDLRRDRPELLDTRYDQIVQVLDWIRTDTGLPNGQIVVGGFSQGAMLATEVALRVEPRPGGLVIWSGTLLSEDSWTTLAASRRGLPVVQTHGRIDPILPFSGAELLRTMLVEAGLDVQFAAFNGPHTIPPSGIELAAARIASIAKLAD